MCTEDGVNMSTDKNSKKYNFKSEGKNITFSSATKEGTLHVYGINPRQTDFIQYQFCSAEKSCSKISNQQDLVNWLKLHGDFENRESYKKALADLNSQKARIDENKAIREDSKVRDVINAEVDKICGEKGGEVFQKIANKFRNESKDRCVKDIGGGAVQVPREACGDEALRSQCKDKNSTFFEYAIFEDIKWNERGVKYSPEAIKRAIIYPTTNFDNNFDRVKELENIRRREATELFNEYNNNSLLTSIAYNCCKDQSCKNDIVSYNKLAEKNSKITTPKSEPAAN